MNDYIIIDETITDPLLSVAMLSFNQENYISTAIDSFLMQKTTFPVQLIISDDCSNDRTRQIILDFQKKNPSKIKLILQNKNVGGSKNNECLLNNLKGKYIAALEGDDFWTDPYKLQKQVDFLENNTDYVLVFHKIKILHPDGKLVNDFVTKVPENYETLETLAKYGNYIHTPSVVFKNVITNLPYEITISPIGDYFLYLILAQHGKLKYFEEEMAVYRFGVGIHSTQGQIKMAKSNFKLFTLLLSYFNDPKINKILLDRQLNALDSFEHLIRNEYREAFISHNIFFKALKSLQSPKNFWKKLRCKLIK